MTRTDKQLSYEERYQQKMEQYAEVYRIRTEFASKFKLKPEKTRGYYNTGDPSANVPASSDSSSGSGGSPATEVPGNGYEEQAWNFFAQKGFTAAATAGIMGNLKQESGVNPTTLQNGGKSPGTGIAQWEKKHAKGGGRWEGLVAWAKSQGRDEWNIVTQLEYLIIDLGQGTTKSILNKNYGGIEGLKKATDYKWAVDAFEKSFERASKPNLPRRYQFALEYLNRFGGGNGSATASVVATGGSTGSNTSEGASAQSLSVKFQVTRDVRTKETEPVDTAIIASYEDSSDSYSTPMVTPIGSMKKGRYSPPNVPRSGYTRSRFEDVRLNGWNGWKPLHSTFIHLGGPQENLYAPEAQVVFTRLKERLGWDKIKVVHGFQAKREEGIISTHNVGMAMDIYVENIYEAIYVADTAWVMGLRAVAIGGSELDESSPGFVHIDCGPKAFWPLNHHDVYKGIGTFKFTKG